MFKPSVLLWLLILIILIIEKISKYQRDINNLYIYVIVSYHINRLDMNDFTEKTAEILDKIIEVTLKNNTANPRNLPPLSNDITASDLDVKYHGYQYYLDIIEKYDFVQVQKYLGDFTVLAIDKVTADFMNNGGFSQLFDQERKRLKQQKEIEALKFKKLKWDAMVSEFQAKTKWWPLIISIISLLISVYLLFIRGGN